MTSHFMCEHGYDLSATRCPHCPAEGINSNVQEKPKRKPKTKKKENPEPPEPKFVLTLTASQAQTLVEALDLFSRIGIGQINEVESVVTRYGMDRKEHSYEAVKNALDFIKLELMGFQQGGSYGIFHQKVHNIFKEAWDLQQVIRHKLAWTANPGGGFGVNFHEPMKSGSTPLATMDVASELENLLQALRQSLTPLDEKDEVDTI
jgi:hypothetical protein